MLVVTKPQKRASKQSVPFIHVMSSVLHGKPQQF